LSVYEQYGSLNARQYAYRAEIAGLVTKKQFGYVISILTQLRKQNKLPWSAVLDSSRHFSPWSVVGNEDIDVEMNYAKNQFKQLPENFNLPKWHYQPVVPVILTEKEGLIPYFESVADEKAVSIYAQKGFVGLSHLHEVVVPWLLKQIVDYNKKIRLLYLGDCDDEGFQIPLNLLLTLKDWIDGSPSFNIKDLYPRSENKFHHEGSIIGFERVALKPEQVEEYNLPRMDINPQSKIARKFVDFKCELEAMDPNILRELIQEKITTGWNTKSEDRRIKKVNEIKEKLKKSVDELTKTW